MMNNLRIYLTLLLLICTATSTLGQRKAVRRWRNKLPKDRDISKYRPPTVPPIPEGMQFPPGEKPRRGNRDERLMAGCRLDEAKACYTDVSDALGGQKYLFAMNKALDPFYRLYWKNPNVSDLCWNLHPNNTHLDEAKMCFEMNTMQCPKFVPLAGLKRQVNDSYIDNYRDNYCHEGCGNLSSRVDMIKWKCRKVVKSMLTETTTRHSIDTTIAVNDTEQDTTFQPGTAVEVTTLVEKESDLETTSEPRTAVAMETTAPVAESVMTTEKFLPLSSPVCRQEQLEWHCKAYEAQNCPGLEAFVTEQFHAAEQQCMGLMLSFDAVFPPVPTTSSEPITEEERTTMAQKITGGGGENEVKQEEKKVEKKKDEDKIPMAQTSDGDTAAQVYIGLLLAALLPAMAPVFNL